MKDRTAYVVVHGGSVIDVALPFGVRVDVVVVDGDAADAPAVAASRYRWLAKPAVSEPLSEVPAKLRRVARRGY